jgi:autotransporter-associated beta strand protein
LAKISLPRIMTPPTLHLAPDLRATLILFTISVFASSHVYAASITNLGTEPGTAVSGYATQNWSNPEVAKEFDLGGSEVYGTAGYYQIRPIALPSGTTIYSGVASGNNLGITEGSNPTLYSAPVILSAITGGAGDYVNFPGYADFRGPNGSTLYNQGGLSVPVPANQGPYNTPSGANTGYFGVAFDFTMGISATYRLGVAVDTVADGTYAPNYVGLYNSGVGTVFSSLLTRDGTPDMTIFEIDAVAGDTFTAAMWQLSGARSAAAFSLITFDVSRYNLNVTSGVQTNSSVLGGAPAALLKTGAGTMVLTGASTYTGATTISNGTLSLDGAGAISTNSAVAIASGAAFDVTGSSAPTNINRTFAGLSGAGTLHGGGGTVTVNKTSGSDTFSGVISGAQGLIKEGAGTLALGGASSYSGATAVNAGTLLIANGAALGATSGGATVASGAQLRLNATDSGFTVGNESLTISGQGVTTGGALRNAAGDNTWQGKVTLVADATIGAATGTSLTMDVASGNAIEAAGFNLTFDGAGTNRVLDSVNLGAGGLTKIGNGTTILAASNNFTGATTVSLGVLNLNSSVGGAAATTSSVSVASDARLLLSQSEQVNDSATVTLSGGTIQRASGVSEVFGSLNLTAGSFLDFGTGATGTIQFGGYTPVNLLTVQNFAQGNVLRFGTDVGSFLPTAGALTNSYFSFNNAFSYDSGSFTITAIPEPSTYLAAAGLLGMMLWSVRRRAALRASFTMTEAPAADGTIPKADGIIFPVLSTQIPLLRTTINPKI